MELLDLPNGVDRGDGKKSVDEVLRALGHCIRLNVA